MPEVTAPRIGGAVVAVTTVAAGVFYHVACLLDGKRDCKTKKKNTKKQRADSNKKQ